MCVIMEEEDRCYPCEEWQVLAWKQLSYIVKWIQVALIIKTAIRPVGPVLTAPTVWGWAWLRLRCSRWNTRRFPGGFGSSRPRPRWCPSCSSQSSTSVRSCGSGRSPPRAQRGWSPRRDYSCMPGLCGDRCPPCSAWSQGRPVERKGTFTLFFITLCQIQVIHMKEKGLPSCKGSTEKLL